MEHSIDREKVIKATELLDDFFNKYRAVYCISPHEAWEIIKDTLKEQEPAMPTWSQGKAYCGKCGQRLPRKRADRKINYCGYCGQAVKWE